MEATLIMVTSDRSKRFFTREQMAEILRAEGNTEEQIRAFFRSLETGTVTKDTAQYDFVSVLERARDKFGADLHFTTCDEDKG